MYIFQAAILGGMGLTITVILTVTSGFALLACFIYWYYRKFTGTAERATVTEEKPVKTKPGALTYIIITLLLIFIFLLVTLLNAGSAANE